MLHENREWLEHRGYCYPRNGYLYINHQPLAWSLIKRVYDEAGGGYWEHARRYANLEASPDEYWARLRDEIEESPASRFVISAEELGVEWDLSTMTKYFRQYVAGLNVKIVVYFRRQDEFLQALYNEAVKGKETRFSGTFWDYVQPILDVGGADCGYIADAWARTVGRENVIVRAYEKEQLPEGLEKDFLSAIEVPDAGDIRIAPGRDNPRLMLWALKLLRRLNRYDSLAPYHGYIVDLLKLVASDRRPFSPHGLLDHDTSIQLYERFVETNRRVAIEYMNRPNGRLFWKTSEEESR